jgi:hypothetical protein
VHFVCGVSIHFISNHDYIPEASLHTAVIFPPEIVRLRGTKARHEHVRFQSPPRPSALRPRPIHCRERKRSTARALECQCPRPPNRMHSLRQNRCQSPQG